MSLHLLQAIFFSLWAVLMLRLYRRAYRLHQAVALKHRAAVGPVPADPSKPMAVRIHPVP